MQPIALARAHQGAATYNNTRAHNAIMALALHLARRLTQPPRAQSRSMEPNSGCCQSQTCRRGELRAAAQPANKMKTVVGSPGTKMPMIPSIRLSTAKHR